MKKCFGFAVIALMLSTPAFAWDSSFERMQSEQRARQQQDDMRRQQMQIEENARKMRQMQAESDIRYHKQQTDNMIQQGEMNRRNSLPNPW